MNTAQRVLKIKWLASSDHGLALIEALKTEVIGMQANDVWREGAGGRYNEDTYQLYAEAMLHVISLAFGILPEIEETAP